MGGQTMVQKRPNDRSSHIFGSPIRKSGAWPGEQAPPALWCPAGKRGGKGEESVCIYMLSGIALDLVRFASGLAIKACHASPWPLPERRPATP